MGESATRLFGLALAGIIRDEQGRVLLLRRRDAAKHFAGRWEPPGGKMAPGEGLDEALRREVAEEAGLDVRLESVAGHSGFDLPRVRVVVLYFNCARCAGEVRLSPGHSDHLWASAEQLREMELTEPFARFVHSAGVVRGPA